MDQLTVAEPLKPNSAFANNQEGGTAMQMVIF